VVTAEDVGCCCVARRPENASRSWVNEAIRKVEADSNRSADTHLPVFPLPEGWDVDLYLKDGRCHLVDDAATIYGESRRLAAETGGQSIFEQLAQERHPVPAWVVVGAGTGGTSATIGRFVRFRRYDTQLCVVDPENSAFFDGWANDDPTYTTGSGSRIEGIGRPRVEPLAGRPGPRHRAVPGHPGEVAATGDWDEPRR
jgi:hypothetical protein